MDTIESVLLHHLVPGATLSYRQPRDANGAVVTTALAGSPLRVRVVDCSSVPRVDADPDARNPFVVDPNLNQGNRQLVHGIDRVLRLVDR